jgi:hypothetical protein
LVDLGLVDTGVVPDTALCRPAGAVVLDSKRREHRHTAVVHPDRQVGVDPAAGLSEHGEVAVGQQFDLRETVEFGRAELTDGVRATITKIVAHTRNPVSTDK